MTNQPELKACELLPCPFCGELPHVEENSHGERMIFCDNRKGCGVIPRTAQMQNYQAVVYNWNTRPSPIIPEDASKYPHLAEELQHVPNVTQRAMHPSQISAEDLAEIAKAEVPAPANALRNTVDNVRRELDMTHHMETVGSDCIDITRDDAELLITHALIYQRPATDAELRDAIKLIWDRGLDTADGRDCAIIKLIHTVEGHLDGGK